MRIYSDDDDDEDLIAEVPDSVIVESQRASKINKDGGSTSREVNIFDDSGFDTDLETERK